MAMIHCGQTCGILDHRVLGKTSHTKHIYEACSEDDNFYLALQEIHELLPYCESSYDNKDY